MSFTSAAKSCVYDSWDLTPPRVSPRSRLYHLKPIGIGTVRTESCTGYIARLAEEHCVSIHSLFRRELVPASNNPNLARASSTFVSSGHYQKVMKSINGRGHAACTWVEVLEKLTLQRGLRFLTMLTWQYVLTAKSLLRTVRAWCPRCLEEQSESGGVVYEHLLWTLDSVDVCFHHQRTLETRCPHCRNQVSPIAHRLRPGHCSRCLGWLGHSDGEKGSFLEAEDFTYKLWVANQMGELIAVAPNQSYDPPRERVTEFVPTCIKRTAGGNVTAFAAIVDIDRIAIYLWLHRKYLPTTDLILKICYRIGVSFSDILTKGDVFSDIELSKHLQTLTQATSVSAPHNDETLKHQLLAALEEDPPPTLREVAERLGYKHTGSLRMRCPELTKLLTAKHRAAFSRTRRRSNGKVRDDARVKLALQKALEKELPPTLDEIAHSLGYAESRSLRKFRSLYDAIVIRRAEYWTWICAQKVSIPPIRNLGRPQTVLSAWIA